MAEKYDLSEETAKARSADVKGFRSHKLLDAKGYAKLGGMQRDGTVAVDRYISYRRGNDIVTLGVWLLKDAPIEDHEFHVSGPASMIEGGKSFVDVRPGISEKDAQGDAAHSRPSRICRARPRHSTPRWRRSRLEPPYPGHEGETKRVGLATSPDGRGRIALAIRVRVTA